MKLETRACKMKINTVVVLWASVFSACVIEDEPVQVGSGSGAISSSATSRVGAFVDQRDGQVYGSVVIDGRTWMAQNLNYAAPGSICYGGLESNCLKYGRLYSWVSAMNFADSCLQKSCGAMISAVHQGNCPSGWHVPSSADLSSLESFSAKSLLEKAAGGLDNYGFGLRFSGYSKGVKVDSCGQLGAEAMLWIAKEDSYQNFSSTRSKAWRAIKGYDYIYGESAPYRYEKRDGLALRCVRD